MSGTPVAFPISSCTPVALGWLLRRSPRAICARIHAAKGDPACVRTSTLEAVLPPIRRRQRFYRPVKFLAWRKRKRGAWVVSVRSPGDRAGHCIALRDGIAYDNGYSRYRGLKHFRVYAARQLV